MEPRRTDARFPTTNWTVVFEAGTSPEQLEKLLARYRSPVYAFLRHRGWDAADAEDITQDFLAQVVLGRDLPGRADPARGRFSGFLLTALRNFELDVQRRRSVRSLPGEGRSSSDDELAGAPDRNGASADHAFLREWATVVFEEAVRRTEIACREAGMTRQWRAFEARVLRPALHDCPPAPVEQVIDELGLADRQEVYDMVRTVKVKACRMLETVVGETVNHPADVDEEIANVRSYLAL